MTNIVVLVTIEGNKSSEQPAIQLLPRDKSAYYRGLIQRSQERSALRKL